MTEALDEGSDQPSDAVLIAAVRAGNTAAYGQLYARHLGAARRAAGSLACSPAERDDVIAEAFTQVLRALRTGRGPDTEFRPYLVVAMRNLALAGHRRTRATVPLDEVPELVLTDATPGDPVTNRVLAGVAAEAFTRLPLRWRLVLWHTEIQGESPTALAPHLGLTPNGVAALACRAREGLRQAYLTVHLPASHRDSCRATRHHLAAWIRRRRMAPSVRQRVSAHLDGCVDCHAVAAELATINRGLAAAGHQDRRFETDSGSPDPALGR